MVTIFYGPDTFRSREAYRAAREAASASTGIPTVVLRDEALSPAAFSTALGGQSLFGGLAPVAAERLTACTGVQGEAVAQCLRAMPDAQTLLVWEEGVPAPNGIVWRALTGVARDTRRFDALPPSAVRAWIGERVRAAGASLDDAARERLQGACGANLWALSTEIAKLTSVAGDRPISAADVADLVHAVPGADLFPTVQAVVRGDVTEALRRLTAFRRAGEDPRRLLFWVLRDLGALLRVSRELAVGRRLTAWDVARSCGVPRDAAERLLATARQTSLKEARVAFDRGVVCYYHLNTGRAEADEVLETLTLSSVSR